MPTLTTTDLGHRFGTLLLFRRMNWTLEGGETLAVTGANGSGKSTLLRILAGVQTPAAGQVQLAVDGHPVERAARPLHTGLVAPYLNAYDALSARENLAFLAQARGLGPGSDRIAAALDRVGLADRAGDLVGTFSSGMKQRVKYAAALLAEPPLLLLDEPAVTLDAAGRAMVDRVVVHQQEKEGLLVIATNQEDEAARCDRTIRIEDFR
jgi:heme exporter protein A